MTRKLFVPHRIILTLLLLAAGLLRFHGLSDRSYIHDEFWSVGGALGHAGEQQLLPRAEILDAAPVFTRPEQASPITAIWNGQRNDVHPPIYYMLLRLWVDVFGTSESATRSLSASLSVLNCLLLYLVALRVTTRPAALFACALMALAAPQIQIAQTARSYALLLTFVLIAFHTLLSIRQAGVTSGRLILLFAATLAMLLTHYESGLVGLEMAVYALALLRGRARVQTVATLATALVAFVILWGNVFHYQATQFAHYDNYWFNEPRAGHVWLVLRRLATLPVTFLQPLLRNSVLLALPAALFYVLATVAVRKRPDLLLGALLLLSVVVPLTIIDLWRSTNYLTFTTYTYLATPAFFVLLPAALAEFPRPWMRHVVPAVAVFGCVVAIPQAYVWDNPDWRQPVRYLDRHIKPGEPVIFSAGTYGTYFTGFLYLATSHYSESFPRPIVLLDDVAPPPLLEQLRQQYPSVWLLESSPLPPPTELLPGFEVVETQFYPNIGFLMRLRPTGPVH